MNEEQARAVDVGIRAIAGATHSASKQEAALLLRARRTLEGMLSEGFVQCRECGRRPTPFAMLDDSEGFAFDGWCAVCRCPRQAAYGKSLDEVRKEWNEEGSRRTPSSPCSAGPSAGSSARSWRTSSPT